MIQPICIMYVPKDFCFGGSDLLFQPVEFMTHFNGWRNENQNISIGGYLWFSFFKEGISEPQFQVFFDKDFTAIQYNELKEIVMKGLAVLKK
jgi:hypothetical protein